MLPWPVCYGGCYRGVGSRGFYRRGGGRVDYNKAVVNDGVLADTGMCRAASASNVLSWWYKQQNKTNTDGDPWYVYRAVYSNVGSTPSYALNWWINGVTNSWGDVTTPTGYDVDGWATVEGKENGEWPRPPGPPCAALLNGLIIPRPE